MPMQVSTSFKLVLRKNNQLQYNGTNRLLLSFATVLQPPNIFRFSSQLCLNGQQLLRSENRFFFIFILKRHYTAPTTIFPYFQISIASFTYFMTMPQTHVIYAPLYAHASYHMSYCKVPLCELQLVMLIYCIRMHIILLCEQCRY